MQSVFDGGPEGRPVRRLWWRSAVIGVLLVLALGTWGAYRVQPVEASQSLQTGGVLAIVGAGRADLLAAPDGTLVRTFTPGTVLTAVGRSADSRWIVVVTDEANRGWVDVEQVVMFGINQLPIINDAMADVGEATGGTPTVVTPVALPTVTPTPTYTPSPVPSPTPTSSPTQPPTPTSAPTATAPPTATPTLASPTRSNSAANTGSGRGGEAQSSVAVVRGGGAALLAEPDGAVLSQLPTGAAVTARARSADSGWLQVSTSTGLAGWLETSKVVIFNVATLPVAGETANTDDAGLISGPTLPEEVNEGGENGHGGDSPAGQLPATVNGSSQDNGNEITATVTLTDSRLNIRSGPGTSYPIVGKAIAAEVLVVAGRDSASRWIQVQTPRLTGNTGWVSVEFVNLSVDVKNIPVVEVQNAPSVLPTPTPEGTTVAAGGTQTVAARSTGTVQGLAGKLVFQPNRGGAIYVYSLESGALATLPSGLDPAISPDGRTVAFTRDGGENGLYLIDIDGRNERKIYSGNDLLRGPSWSPDGAAIVFSRGAGYYECRDLGFGICIPDNPFLKSFPLARVREYGLSRIDVDGQNFRDLPALSSAQSPDWHRDGIVYTAVNGLEITTGSTDDPSRVLLSGAYYQNPVWQPGGDRIAFQSREGSHWEIFVVNASGGGPAALTRPVTTLVDELPSNAAPAWSPDGAWIAYLSNRTDRNAAGPWRLWVMDANGGNQRPLPVPVEIDYGFGNEKVVSWGP
jgi:Tol biopolymer transport system component/uncharacterized protein YraI